MIKVKASLSFPPRQRYFIYGSLSLLALSGLAWLASRYGIEGREGMGDLALNVQYWALKFHGAGMMLTLLALGSSLEHVRAGMREKRFKAMGVAVLTIVGILLITGWLIYYGPSGDSHDLISVAHWSFGLLAAAVFIAHVVIGKKKARRRR